MPRVKINKVTRDLEYIDSDENCPDPLATFCDKHPWYGAMDSFLAKHMLILIPIVIILAIIVGTWLKWHGELLLNMLHG